MKTLENSYDDVVVASHRTPDSSNFLSYGGCKLYSICGGRRRSLLRSYESRGDSSRASELRDI